MLYRSMIYIYILLGDFNKLGAYWFPWFVLEKVNYKMNVTQVIIDVGPGTNVHWSKLTNHTTTITEN